LARLGDERVLPHMKGLVEGNYELREMLIAAGWVHSKAGAATQADLLDSLSPLLPLFSIGHVDFDSLPSGVSRDQARRLLEMSAAVGSRYLRPYRVERKRVTLSLSPDGEWAICRLAASYGSGMAARGDLYCIMFRRVGDQWFLVAAWDGGSWIS
jgi:hypothetical protein